MSMWSVTAPDGTVSTGWILVPLRLFLGFTFLFAGLQKLANPQFLASASPTSIHAQLVGASRSSPIHALISHLVPIASTVGVVIALGEVAIGLGVLVGLLTRVAAVAGMALSFGLFLTVSFHSSPYFTGSDIVFFFAWTPLALAGAAGAPALDTWMASRQPAQTVGQGGLPRRAVLSAGAVTGIVAATVLVASGVAAGPGSGGRRHLRLHVGRRNRCSARGRAGHHHSDHGAVGNGDHHRAVGNGTTAPPGSAIGPASDVPVGGSATFTDPASGDPGLVIQQTAGTSWPSTRCAPTPAALWPTSGRRASSPAPATGPSSTPALDRVLRGPATRGLTPIKAIKGANGDLYVV